MTQIPGLSIIPNYISEQEEQDLIKYIDQKPWSSAIYRRTQHYGYEYSYAPPYEIKRTEDIPDFLKKYAVQICPDFNQIIVNEYDPGQGIGKHTDHKRHFGNTIASISLGSAVIMEFENEGKCVEIYLQPRTLLIMTGEARSKWTHAIPARKTDTVDGKRIARTKRISLTFRIVKT